ncbi:hypothetical protein GCM10022409_31590 [Hymenobacter glaciei]|uniref:Carboxypeptidase regulatory-like domain-containing protein n=1 Tax=Hymenobacter glaciei TaxID=877209 RepID=A0ABP7UI20_9BACT
MLLFSLLLAGCAVRSSQSTTQRFQKGRSASVSGYVLDAATCQPMAGVPVAKNGAQTRTAKDGFFRLKYPLAQYQLYMSKELDELGVYSLNYAGSAAIPADTAQRVTLLLVRNTYRFPPHGHLRPADSVHVSPCRSPWQSLPGSQRAFLIQDSSIHQPRKLRALTFRVGKEGFGREPFRVRIYQYNGPDKAPGEDLLTENFVVSAGTEGTLTYDLTDYDVKVSGNGFFLALEYVVSGDKFYLDYHMVGYVPTGPVLHPPYVFANTRTWFYIIGKGWQRQPPAENCWPLYESALSVEVEPVPKQPTGR